MMPAPGPIHLEIRVNGKIRCFQHVHSFDIDQTDDLLTVTGVLKLPEQKPDEPKSPAPDVKSAPKSKAAVAELKLEAAGDVTKKENARG